MGQLIYITMWAASKNTVQSKIRFGQVKKVLEIGNKNCSSLYENVNMHNYFIHMYFTLFSDSNM